MQNDDLLYYRHRAEAEIDRAQEAEHPRAAAAHYQLATLYLDRMEDRADPGSAIHD